jgi:hypothetical protein
MSNVSITDKVDWVKINEKAKELYDKAKFTPEIKNYPYMPSPENWLYNQTNLREIWREYKQLLKCVDTPQIAKDIVMANSFAIYMEFMYNSYPDFDFKLAICYDYLGKCRDDVTRFSRRNPLGSKDT